MHATQRVAIILPAHNEELTIGQTIKAFHHALPHAAIVIVNNNSQDQTALVATQALLSSQCPGRVIHEPRQGKGNALRRAFSEVEADIYVIADADLTYPAERIHDLMRPIVNNEADMVVDDRHSDGHYARENKRPLHQFGNTLIKRLINVLFRSNLNDIMSGYRVFTRRFVKNYPILVEGFQIETDMTLHALHKRFRVVEIPVEYKDRPEGSVSKLNTFSDGAKVIMTIAHILRYYRPMAFFSVLALVFVIAGLIAAIPVIRDWVRYQYVYHVPLAILATGLQIVAIMLMGIGLILDAVMHKQRFEYEANLLAQRNGDFDS